MENLASILAEHPFFKDLESRHLELIAGCASNARFDAGQLIFHEGEEANHLFLIRHGTVSLEIFAPDRGAIVIQTLGEGEILGWSWLIPPYHWHFDARATSLTRVTILDARCLRTKCEEDHDVGYEVVKRFAHLIAQRLEATRLQLLDVYGVRG